MINIAKNITHDLFQFQVLSVAQVRQLHTDVSTDRFGKWNLIESQFQQKGLALYPDLSGNVQALETVPEEGKEQH